jgi:hypothetical protein
VTLASTVATLVATAPEANAFVRYCGPSGAYVDHIEIQDHEGGHFKILLTPTWQARVAPDPWAATLEEWTAIQGCVIGLDGYLADSIFDQLQCHQYLALGPTGETFDLESWRVIVEGQADGRTQTEATVKLFVDGERYVRTAEGNGPVNALDAALRAAICEVHPHLREVELVNYKVRILDEAKGTGAVTRVLLDASDGQELWGSIGVHENVIAASWQALVDSLEHPMQPGKDQHARATRAPA